MRRIVSFTRMLAPGLLLGLPFAATAQQHPAALVDVTDSRFAQGCPNAADPLGHADSTCAIRKAVQYAESNGLPGAGFPIVYFPHGLYRVGGEGYTAAITITKRISLQGDGPASSVLLNTSAKANLLTYLQAQGCSDAPGFCAINIQGLSFAGNGSKTTGGLVELDSSPVGYMRNVSIANEGGIGLNLQGSSERWHFEDMEISSTRWGVVTEGDTNENYFDRVNVLDTGYMPDNYCYSINCPGGKLITSGVWRADPHSAVFLDGDNVHWSDSSIKSALAVGGIRMSPADSSISRTYIEGYPWGGQPRLNAAISAPGKIEIGHLTADISNTALEIPVDDAGWQPLYVNDPTQAHINGEHSYVNYYMLFPADYLRDSKEPSRAVPGILRGTTETVHVAAFSGDGQAHLIRRGDHAVAWPKGTIMEQVAAPGYGGHRIEQNHLNSIIAKHDARFQIDCDDTAQLPAGWQHSPSKMCAEILAGYVPDGFIIPFPSETWVSQIMSLRVTDNSLAKGDDENIGAGWVKIAAAADVTIEQQDGPLRTAVDPHTALHRYVNDAGRAVYIEWPGLHGAAPASAYGNFADPSAGVRFSPNLGYYQAQVVYKGSLSEQQIHAACVIASPAKGQQEADTACMPNTQGAH